VRLGVSSDAHCAEDPRAIVDAFVAELDAF
jgi:hypothetical protein